MFYKSLHIFGVITSVAALRDSHEGLHSEGDLGSIKLNPRIIENREQLKRVIRYLNGHHDEYEGAENRVLGNFVPKGADIENNIVNEQEARILAALSLLQKNYNNLLRNGNEERKPRLLYINNPDVLKEYKNSLRSSLPWFASESSDFDSEGRMLSDEPSGHRMFDTIGSSKYKNVEKPHNHNRLRHKNHGTKSSNDQESKNGEKKQKKGRFNISRDIRIPQVENKRPRIEKKEDKRLMLSEEISDTSNLKIDKNEKIPANVVMKEFKKSRDIPIRPKYTEKEFPEGNVWNKAMDEDHFLRKKHAVEGYKSKKRGGRISHSLGRTFIPYIATKTVYEDD